MLFNAQKTTPQQPSRSPNRPKGFANSAQIKLKISLFQLQKLDPNKKPAEYQRALTNLTTFLQTDDGAPCPQNPFLKDDTLAIVKELVSAGKLPDLNSGFQPGNPPWTWGQGISNLAIATKLTETSQNTIAELRNAGDELAKNPNSDPAQARQKADTVLQPFRELLEKYVPPDERQKYFDVITQAGHEIMAEKLADLDRFCQEHGASPQEREELKQNIQTVEKKARQFTNSEEYIQHRLTQYEKQLNNRKLAGKIIGDITVGTGIVFFAPTPILPFIIAGYIGHTLSTTNIAAAMDRKENQLRHKADQIDQQLDVLSRRNFGTLPQKLASHLARFNFLPRPDLKNQPQPSRASQNGQHQPAKSTGAVHPATGQNNNSSANHQPPAPASTVTAPPL